MANEAQVSLTGYVATQPSFWTTTSGAPKVTMRVAWTPRHIDRVTGEWTDGNTSRTVVCWRKLADNGHLVHRRGDPVVVKGRLSVGLGRTAYPGSWSGGCQLGPGHDMSRGAAHFRRTKRAPAGTAAGQLMTGSAPAACRVTRASAAGLRTDGGRIAAGGERRYGHRAGGRYLQPADGEPGGPCSTGRSRRSPGAEPISTRSGQPSGWQIRAPRAGGSPSASNHAMVPLRRYMRFIWMRCGKGAATRSSRRFASRSGAKISVSAMAPRQSARADGRAWGRQRRRRLMPPASRCYATRNGRTGLSPC